MAGNIINSLLGEANTTPGTFLDTFMNATAKPSQITPAPVRPEPEPEVAPPPHKRSGLHDFLGYVKDAALVSAGLKPEYQPQKIAEKEGAALEGFDSDPIAAIHRLVQINPDKARALYNDMIANNQRTASMGSSEAAAEASRVAAAAAKQAAATKAFGAAGAILRTANAKNYPVMKDRVAQFLSSRGVDSPLPLPDAYDPDAINAWANAGVDTDKQVDNERQADVVDETKRHHAVAESLQATGVGISGSNSAESARHNRVSEDIAAKGLDIRDRNSVSQADYRDWMKAHPAKSRGGFSGMGGGSVPPIPPASAKGKVATKDGVTWKSDGKAWIRQ